MAGGVGLGPAVAVALARRAAPAARRIGIGAAVGIGAAGMGAAVAGRITGIAVALAGAAAAAPGRVALGAAVAVGFLERPRFARDRQQGPGRRAGADDPGQEGAAAELARDLHDPLPAAKHKRFPRPARDS